MRRACEDFFAARLPVLGLAACAARLPDGMVIHQCFNRWLTPNQVRQALGHLAHAAETLQQHHLAPIRLVWAFEHVRIYLRLRPDTACLALFLENRPELPGAEIDSLLEQFADLSMTSVG